MARQECDYYEGGMDKLTSNDFVTTATSKSITVGSASGTQFTIAENKSGYKAIAYTISHAYPASSWCAVEVVSGMGTSSFSVTGWAQRVSGSGNYNVILYTTWVKNA